MSDHAFVVCFAIGLLVGWVIESARQRRQARALLKHFQTNIAVHDAPTRAEINAGEETG
jgi:hypothetical protein